MRDRLLSLAKKRGEEFQRVLIRFGIERLLYRLSVSDHGQGFVLKGATLFAVWADAPHRPTKDLDLLGFGSPDAERLLVIFREVVALGVEGDGLLREERALIRKRRKYSWVNDPDARLLERWFAG